MTEQKIKITDVYEVTKGRAIKRLVKRFYTDQDGNEVVLWPTNIEPKKEQS